MAGKKMRLVAVIDELGAAASETAPDPAQPAQPVHTPQGAKTNLGGQTFISSGSSAGRRTRGVKVEYCDAGSHSL
jgi:hypothetical protein